MKTRDMVLISLFSVLTIVGAYISIPIPPVPVTFQNLMCILAGGIIGSKKGAISQILYMLMGLIGLPVFAGGKGGLNQIASPTFGYIIGFIICAYIVGVFSERGNEKTVKRLIIGAFLGTIAIYIVGTAYLFGILNFVLGKPTSVYRAVELGIIPFFVKDIIVAVAGAFIIKKAGDVLKRAGYSS